MSVIKSTSSILSFIALLSVLTACGGGSGGGSIPQPPPKPESFTLSVSTANLELRAGEAASLDITVNAQNGFSGSVTLSVSGLPEGSGAVFSSNPVSAGKTARLAVAALANSPSYSGTVLIEGRANALSDARSVSLRINPADTPGIVSNRSTFFYTENYLRNVVYDSKHKLVFATNTSLNQIEVFSLETGKKLPPILLSQPYCLDLSPDNSRLWVGTTGEYLYAIDTERREVVEHVTPPRTTSLAAPFPTTSVRDIAATSNGSLLLRIAGYKSSFERLYQYFPSTGEFIDRTGSPPLPGYIGPVSRLMRSSDGSKVLLGQWGKVTVYDSATDTFLQNTAISGSPTGAIRPDGQQLFISTSAGLLFLDSELQPIGQLTTERPPGNPVYSADGKYVFTPKDTSLTRTDNTILAIDTTTFQPAGGVPDIYLSQEGLGCDGTEVCDMTLGGTTLKAATDTGLLLGSTPSGLSILEGTPLVNLPPAAHFLHDGAATPAVGDPNRITDVAIVGFGLSGAKIAFGKNMAPIVSDDQNDFRVLAPPSEVLGPVNILAEFPDGWIALAPDGFSYGPHIDHVDPLGSSAIGGSTITIWGKGFGTDKNSISLKIGGRDAPIQAVQQVDYFTRIVATIPPGTPGAHDIVVSTPTGSTKASEAFHYVQNVQDYAIPGSFFVQILFDKARSLVYLLDISAGQIQVFSVSSRQLKGSISIGGNPLQMVLLPGDGRLAVVNNNDVLTIVDPEHPDQREELGVALQSNPLNLHSWSVGASSDGKIFIGYGATGYFSGMLRVVDVPSLAVSTVTEVCPIDFCYIESTSDGKKVLFGQVDSTSGNVSTYDALTHSFSAERPMNAFLNEIALAEDGNRAVFNYHVLDSSNVEAGDFSLPKVVAEHGSPAVRGRRIHESGGLLYVPHTDGMQIFDMLHGRMLRSYAGMVFSKESPYTIAIDEAGATVFALSENGLEIVTLDSVPLSIGHANPELVPTLVQSPVTLRGSGFTPATHLIVNGAEITPEFVDGNTLQFLTPPLAVGAVSITVYNDGGESYKADEVLHVF